MTHPNWIFLAQVATPEPSPLKLSPHLLLLLGVVGLLVLAMATLVYLLRRPKEGFSGWRTHHRHHSRSNSQPESEPEHGHRRRRRRRREHRPRNPTLAETGGLPPVRSEDGQENNPQMSRGESTS